jgi:hypothetical protein
MFPATARLGAAYRATAYVGRWAGRDRILRIGTPPPRLPWGACRHACFITACNPASRRCPAAFNHRAARRLLAALRRGGLRAAPVVARGDGGDWPPEPGLLVFGLTRRAAAALGRQARQNAILHIGRRAVVLVPLA